MVMDEFHGPYPDLNRLAATGIMGWEEVTSVDPPYQGKVFRTPEGKLYITEEYLSAGFPDPWTPLTDMNQCMMVVEKMHHLVWELWLIRTSGTKTAATFCRYKTSEDAHWILDDIHEWVWRNTPNEAILTAALRAKGVLEEK